MVLQLSIITLSPWDALVRWTLPGTIAAVPAALWPHRRHAGVWVMYVGLAANFAVVAANGGLMPIERSTVEAVVGPEQAARYESGSWIRGSKDVLVEPGRAPAIPLGDSIVIRLGSRGLVASPGDLVIAAGMTIIVAGAAWSRLASDQRLRAGPISARRARGGATTP